MLIIQGLISGLIATLIESIIGASVQTKYTLLSNEFVNFIQTTLAAVFVIAIAIIIN